MAKRLVPLAVAAAAATISLSGCAQAGGHAATVGDAVVTTSDVDFLTRMQCTALDAAAKDPSQSGQVTTAPTRLVRAQMLNALVQSQVDGQLAKAQHADYDRSTYRQVMDQFEPAVQAAPAKDRDHFRALVGALYRGQIEVYGIAQKQLALQGVAQPTDTQVQAAAAAVEAHFRKTLTIKINPVYGADDADVAGSVEPSLSRAVSSFAKGASSAQPTATFVNALPTNQRCG